MSRTDGARDTRAEKVLARVLLAATRALPRHRMRTRLSICAEALRLWRDQGGDAPADEALLAQLSQTLEQYVASGYVTVGGPSDKRVQLNSRGKDYVARVLKVT